MTDTFTRPNGKTYRPRKPGLVTHAWENTEYPYEAEGVIVFGTLDPDLACDFARKMCRYWHHRSGVSEPRPGWYRNGYRDGERAWLDDPERGRPGVQFTATDTWEVPCEAIDRRGDQS